jgi:hypothetical protein
VLLVLAVAAMVAVAGCGGGPGGNATNGTNATDGAAGGDNATTGNDTGMENDTGMANDTGMENDTGMANDTGMENDTGMANDTGMDNATNMTGNDTNMTGMDNATNMTGNDTNMTGMNATNGTNMTGMNATNGTNVSAAVAGDDPTTDAPWRETAEGSLRVAHLSPDAPAVDVLVNGAPFATDVAFGNVTEYTPVEPGEYNVTITAANNSSQVVFEENVSVGEINTTAAAVGEISENGTEEFDVLFFQDDAVPGVEPGNVGEPTEPGNNASVRLAHASPDAGPVDVTVNVSGSDAVDDDVEEPLVLFDNVSYGEATEYVEIGGGNYSLEIRTATESNTGEIVETVDVNLENGSTYSTFAAGYVVPEDAPADTPFEVILANDGGQGIPEDEVADEDVPETETDNVTNVTGNATDLNVTGNATNVTDTNVTNETGNATNETTPA